MIDGGAPTTRTRIVLHRPGRSPETVEVDDEGTIGRDPATLAIFAQDLVVTESAVEQQLARRDRKFDVGDGPDRRARLADGALLRGAVGAADLRCSREGT